MATFNVFGYEITKADKGLGGGGKNDPRVAKRDFREDEIEGVELKRERFDRRGDEFDSVSPRNNRSSLSLSLSLSPSLTERGLFGVCDN